MGERIGIIGGGIVGIAVARSLLQRGPGDVTVIEKEHRLDFAAITEAMAQDVRTAGGTILLGQEAVGIAVDGGKVRVRTAVSEHVFDRLIACAGLQSDVVARLLGADPSPKILPFRGEYWQLDPKRNSLVRGMIYPVPDPRFPFLGVHFTRGVYDDVHVGPNAARAGARGLWLVVGLRQGHLGIIAVARCRALAKKHWRMGVDEISASLVKAICFRKARRFIPELEMADLTAKTASGVRPQAWGRDGALLDDFAVEQVGPVTLLRNAPSPAATSCMAIADHLVENYLQVRA